ncbi:hypothetical protein EON63_20380 [archaeon]|nr:MAG: hypothetical protein EON63_20380 [archaeon]
MSLLTSTLPLHYRTQAPQRIGKVISRLIHAHVLTLPKVMGMVDRVRAESLENDLESPEVIEQVCRKLLEAAKE